MAKEGFVGLEKAEPTHQQEQTAILCNPLLCSGGPSQCKVITP